MSVFKVIFATEALLKYEIRINSYYLANWQLWMQCMNSKVANLRAELREEVHNRRVMYGNSHARGRIPWETMVRLCRHALTHLLRTILSYHCLQPSKSREKSLKFLRGSTCFSRRRFVRASRTGSGRDLTWRSCNYVFGTDIRVSHLRVHTSRMPKNVRDS